MHALSLYPDKGVKLAGHKPLRQMPSVNDYYSDTFEYTNIQV